MNDDRDFDGALRQWLDEGADVAPERFVWAALDDVERTAQRGAWRASLGETLMHSKLLTAVFSVSAIIFVAIAALQLFGDQPVGPSVATATPIATVSSTPTAESSAPALIEPGQLAAILVDGEGHGWEQIDLMSMPDVPLAFRFRSGAARELADQLLRDRDVLGDLSREYTGPGDMVYVTWGAAFASEAGARRAAEIYVADFTSGDGWDLEGGSTEGPTGIEGAQFEGMTASVVEMTPTVGEKVPAIIRIWTTGNLVLILAAFGDEQNPNGLHMIGDNMMGRARDALGVSF